MATAYRFIIEQRITNVGSGGGGRMGEGSSATTSRKTPSKKGRKTVTLLGSMKGGVEHNRKMRALNPVANKAIPNYEKGMRLGRAGLGLLKFDAETGAFAGVSGVSIAIFVALALQTIMKVQNQQRQNAQAMNTQNFNMLESGVGAVHGEYNIAVDLWNTKATYNQNK